MWFGTVAWLCVMSSAAGESAICGSRARLVLFRKMRLHSFLLRLAV